MVHGGGHHRSGGGGGGGGGGASRPSPPVTRQNHGSGHHASSRSGGNQTTRITDNNQSSNRSTSSNTIGWWGQQQQHQHYYHQPAPVIVHQPAPVIVGVYPSYPRPYHTTTTTRGRGVRGVGHAEPHVPRRNDNGDEDDDCCDCDADCCSCCCFNLCCQVLCIGVLCRACCGSSSSSSDHHRQQPASSSSSSRNLHGLNEQQRGKCCHGGGLGAFLSLFLILISIAASGMKDDWTMNAGETRRVQPSFFTKAVTITATTGSSSSSGSSTNVNVYDMPTCPPLTGPIVTMQDSHTLTLGAGDYQYDYFYLNAGSTIQLQVKQQQQKNAGSSSSSTQVFIFQGQDKLNDLENGNADNQDFDDFARNALVSRSITGSGASANLMYRVKTSDIYILVYDNTSSSSSSDYHYNYNMQSDSVIDVDFQLSLTSFDLANHTPMCQETAAVPGRPGQECVVDYSSVSRGGCIIVQATGGSGSGSFVHVQVAGHRQWILLFLCASIPFFIGLFATRYCRRDTEGHGGYEPVFTAADVNPPPTAPQYYTRTDDESNTPPPPPPQPSAPPAPFDSSTDPLFIPPPIEAPTAAAVAAATPFAEAHIIVDPNDDYRSIPIVSAENVVAIPAEKQ
jgi:hypothetical protein